MKQLLKRSSNASSPVDPMPSLLVKVYLDVLINPITNIINKSLSLVVFPSSIKPLIRNTVYNVIVYTVTYLF